LGKNRLVLKKDYVMELVSGLGLVHGLFSISGFYVTRDILDWVRMGLVLKKDYFMELVS